MLSFVPYFVLTIALAQAGLSYPLSNQTPPPNTMHAPSIMRDLQRSSTSSAGSGTTEQGPDPLSADPLGVLLGSQVGGGGDEHSYNNPNANFYDPGPAPKNNGSHAKVEQIDNSNTYGDASSEDSSLGDDSSSQSGGPPGDDSASETGVSSEGIGGFGSL